MPKLFNRLNVYKCVWLAGLSLFFFASYNFANWLTSQRQDVPSLFFSWEHSIPLWPWTIVPYWSIDLMYGLAILLTSSWQSLKTLGLRLLTAQMVCIICFLLFPLKFYFDRPVLNGFLGLLFDILMGFDKPFNQAPSLHITLLVILWQFYAQYFRRLGRYILHFWCFLIALSVLTTWQHHFFDIPTGLWVGCLCIWLWPDNRLTPSIYRPLNYHWTIVYLVLSLLSLTMAIYLSGWALWLLWLAGALVLVAVNYLFFGASGFQKQQNGRFKLAVNLLYLPYFIIMWLNSRIWTIRHQADDLIADDVYLGRIPSTSALNQHHFISVVDLCAELPIGHFKGTYTLIPVLDMTPLSQKECQQAAQIIEQYRQQGKLLVCCGLGYSRSATAVVAWLLWTKKVNNLQQAINKVKKHRHSIVISNQQQLILANWLANIKDGTTTC
ncbi:phosphatase PAP2/dual specificity phosphatase family protein [Gilliamella apicola]|uniref:Serine/threonine protein phosphatase n=1 Tax=Gilliamella apicola TaxID=1196095 RepID=A0A2V4DVL2_9GAMM|nr:phosphatase PAP2/dual specificity phosphatase family protein [Gilliamella apicola]PXZ04253.1 serine/threonine protein phosphatase [Gilliamella apicola]